MATDNKIVAENQLPGSPDWDISTPDSSIEGFTTDISTNVGGQVSFKINTDASDYRIEIYRLGYYGGDGARLVDTIDHQAPSSISQPAPLVDPATGMVDAGNWFVTDTWGVPANAVSGLYVAKLVKLDGSSGGSGENQIPFVIRDDGSSSDLVFQTSDETWEAYNTWGGQNLYDGTSHAVSYNRPLTTRSTKPDTSPFGAEYATIYWLEKNGYDVSYITNADTARSGNLLLNHKAFLSVGHDEYWSAEQAANVQAAANAGVNLAFLSGNEMYWKTQWASSLDGSTPYRSVITYKTSQTGIQNPSGVWTGTWRDPAGASSGGGIPENALTGQLYMVNDPGAGDASITVPYEDSQFRFWRNTSVANLQPGQVASLIPGLLGYEFNADIDNGYRPAGLIDLSSTPVSVPAMVQDATGTVYGPGQVTQSFTIYRNASGALVFNGGTVFWGFALDTNHDAKDTVESPPADPNIQQATVNLFADMGIQPATLQAGLIPASQSTDHSPPVSQITNYIFGDNTITVSGTASDVSGGLVAAVEVSLDGGSTWHKASGTSNWSIIEQLSKPSEFKIIARAVDDSVNLETQQINFANVADFSGYYSAYADVAASGLNPAYHYHVDGWIEGRDPNASFDTDLYLLHNPDVAAAGVDPYQQYLEYGKAEGRQTYSVIGNNLEGDFDPAYYLLTNPDVGAAGVDPYEHFLEYGWHEGRNPNAYFNVTSYLADNPDVAVAGINPLLHYEDYGWSEDRPASSTFDTAAYLSANPDVAAAGIDPLEHYLLFGAKEGRPA